MDWSRFDNHRRFPVAGSQFHQPALFTASMGLIRQHTDRCEREATLLREPDNGHDPKAVQVMVDGLRVGYVKSGTAKRLNKRVQALEEEAEQETYPLLIRMQAPGLFQAHLQIPYESVLLEGYRNPKRS